MVVPEHVALVMEGIVLQYCTAACTALVFFRLAKEIFFFCSDKNANNKEKLIKPFSVFVFVIIIYIVYSIITITIIIFYHLHS